MNESLSNILVDNGEVLLGALLENEVLKEIPVIGTSLNIYKSIKGVRDTAYLNKVKIFIESVGSIDNKQKEKLIEESKKDEKRRSKFGDAMFTTIEKSDSRVKLEYLAVAFEAFLNGDFDQSNLRLICHIINSSFSDDLVDVIENEYPTIDLKYLVTSGLAETEYRRLTADMETTDPD
ncbi:MAG: hypothetical protein RIC95_14175 [Vicingaceae bacterium]